MYLKSIILKNFRKFADTDNEVKFVDSRAFRNGTNPGADITLQKQRH